MMGNDNYTGFAQRRKQKLRDHPSHKHKYITEEEELMLKGKEVEDWLYNNEDSFSNEELKLEDSIDDKEILSRITSNFGPTGSNSDPNNIEQGEQRTKTSDFNDWMYQTVGSFNDKSGAKNYDNYRDALENDENMSPNLHYQIENSHLEEFMQQQEKVFKQDTFSIDSEHNLEYDDLESYMKNLGIHK